MLPLLLILASADPFAKYECNRCHEGVGAPAKLEKHCTRCHDAIREGTWNAPTELMDEWRPNLESFAAVPSLEDLHGFRRGWVLEFLLKPYDVRPNLNGMMPRFPMTPADAVAMARRLVKVRGDEPMPAFAAERIAEGRRLFAELDCGACHAYSGVLPARARSGDAPAMLLAPDLRHTRARLQPSFVRASIADPSVRSKALMPRFDLNDAQADALTAFVLGEEIGPLAEDPMPSRLPLLDRRVGFTEVKQQIFEKHCQHCHANPEKSFNDGGAGNTGGFGYRGKKLSLASYREVQSGSIDEHGNRWSIFAKQGDTPRIIAHLLARREEVRGREVEGVLGMPMALPPLSAEQIQLLESWIAQGRPM